MLHHDAHDEFLSTAAGAMQGGRGADALVALGWWELLASLDDPDARAAVLAAFRAQGRELADTAALGGLLAQPFAGPAGFEPGTVVAAIARTSPRRGRVWIVVGDPAGRGLLFDEPGRGAVVLDAAEVGLQAVEIPGRCSLAEATVDMGGHRPVVDDATARPLRSAGTRLARLAASLEILGAAERAVELAVAHAADREQFGRPIGTFQAVRHLLAWARTDCVAVEGVLDMALSAADPAARIDEVAKAIAGRNGRRACERSLQVLGAIGFTLEHDHHHHHSRVLALDSLLGSSAELAHGLGSWLRHAATRPGYAASAILSGA
jgi:hypothetical protein